MAELGNDARARTPTAAGTQEELGSPAVTLSDVHKDYGSGDIAVHALRGVSLEIPAGQFVVVLGPSGSGKTTLMNLIGGLEPVTSGQLLIASRDLGELDDATLTTYRREAVGFVFQFFNLVPTLTALENVQLVAEMVGRSADDAVAALRAVGLDERADHFPAALSGGEQQRVAIARAVVKRPTILLCDEPTGSLDLETGREVLSVLRRVNGSERRTTVLVTHNSAIAAIADRVIRMRSGTIVEDRVVAAPIAPEDVSW